MQQVNIRQIKNIKRTCEIFEQGLLSIVKAHHLLAYAHDMVKVRKSLDDIIANLETIRDYKESNGKAILMEVIRKDINLVIFYYENACKNLKQMSLNPATKIAMSSHCLFQIQSLKNL